MWSLSEHAGCEIATCKRTEVYKDKHIYVHKRRIKPSTPPSPQRHSLWKLCSRDFCNLMKHSVPPEEQYHGHGNAEGGKRSCSNASIEGRTHTTHTSQPCTMVKRRNDCTETNLVKPANVNAKKGSIESHPPTTAPDGK